MRFFLGFLILLALAVTSCSTPSDAPQQFIQVNIVADGGTRQVRATVGSTVQEVLSAAGVEIGTLDRVEPALPTSLTGDSQVEVVRVEEEYQVEQVVLPFEHRVLRNESLPEGESRLMQPGVNGLQEVTYRKVFENGQEVSRHPVKTVIITEAVPEIVMIGSQLPFAPFEVGGRLAYLAGGYAWLIEGDTGNRRPVITTGDLDGRVFSLSPDAEWLLFTRRAPAEKATEYINSLWAARLPSNPALEVELVDLNVQNVIHFADWRPGSTYTIAYSTVEPRTSAPGWQANNDLRLLSLNSSGQVKELEPLLDTNMGGKYGWWGTTFAWSPDGQQIAYARPDSVGLVNMETGAVEPRLDIIPYQTRSDWAWVPGICWTPDSKVLYTVDHLPSTGVTSPEESPVFDLSAVPMEAGPNLHIVSQSGMFTYPLASPVQVDESGESASLVAYLQAIFPSQSDTSRYELYIMDRDGSNRSLLFPTQGAPGLEPQIGWGVWSPGTLEESGSYALGIVYQDNLWIVEISGGITRQVTGDGLVVRVDWK